MTLQARFISVIGYLAEGRRPAVLMGLTLTLLVFWLQFRPPQLVNELLVRIDYLLYDLRLAAMPKPVRNPDHRIVIVDLDERSLQAEGQYPWNRFKVGRLVEKLHEKGALVVGFDITFPEPNRGIDDILALAPGCHRCRGLAPGK